MNRIADGSMQWAQNLDPSATEPLRLVGVSDILSNPLLGLDAKPLISQGKEWSDSESLASSNSTDPANGMVFVSFERKHRVWKYDFGSDSFSAVPQEVEELKSSNHIIGQCESNGGVEAMERTEDGSLIVFCEYPIESSWKYAEGYQEEVAIGAGWQISSDGQTSAFRYLQRRRLGLVALAKLPNEHGDGFLILERFWSRETGNIVRLRYFSSESLKASQSSDCIIEASLIAELNGTQHQVDNFEGLSVVRGPPQPPGQEDRVLVAVISDDNFNPQNQRTLILTFHLAINQLSASRCLDPLELEETAVPVSKLHVSEGLFIAIFILVGVPGCIVTLGVTAILVLNSYKRPQSAMLRVLRGEARFQKMATDVEAADGAERQRNSSTTDAVEETRG